jgi:hypothetical protein
MRKAGAEFDSGGAQFGNAAGELSPLVDIAWHGH